MEKIIKLEEAGMLALAIYLNTTLPYAGWLYWVLFLTPDVGMIGYTISPRVGAFTYNLFHHKGLAIVIYITGVFFAMEPLQLTGLLLFGHSAFDRLLGYGLKYDDNFKHTHLGWIGQTK